jgi:hypothetical protein
MPEELWLALLHQHNLSGGSTGGVDNPANCVGQPEEDEALGIDDDEELQEVGPQRNEGSQHLRRQAAGSCDYSNHTGRAISCGPGSPTAGGRGPRAASTCRSTRSMLPGARGADAAATGDGAFRAPLGAGPRRVKALEVPGAARPATPCIGTPMHRGPPVPGVHRAGTFAMFLLPGGAHGALFLSQIQRRRRMQRDPCSGRSLQME